MLFRVFRRAAVFRNLLWDVLDTLQNRRDPLIPPRHIAGQVLSATSRSFHADYRQVGQEFVRIFRDTAGVRPDAQILEIGSGTGRIAAALTEYLGKEGHYTGIDVSKAPVDWCQKHITSRFPNFEFIHVDVTNLHYNPAASTSAAKYKLPFADAAFDFVYLTSVFTHMRPAEVDNYLGEIQRVLKPEAYCLMTAFLLNEAARSLIQKGGTKYTFQHNLGGYYAEWADLPERAVAFDETTFRKLIADNRLALVEPIHFGKWAGRSEGLSAQDIILVKRV